MHVLMLLSSESVFVLHIPWQKVIIFKVTSGIEPHVFHSQVSSLTLLEIISGSNVFRLHVQLGAMQKLLPWCHKTEFNVLK